LLFRHGTKRKRRVSDSSEPTTAAAPQSATDVARDS
jgi:hypothetical protein